MQVFGWIKSVWALVLVFSLTAACAVQNQTGASKNKLVSYSLKTLQKGNPSKNPGTDKAKF